MAEEHHKTHGEGIDRKLHDPISDKLIPLEPLDLSKIHTVDDLVRAMGNTAFTGRQVGEGAEVLEAMARDKDCFVVAKARELLSEDVGAQRDDSNSTDDGFVSVLTDAGDRPARLELVEFIEGLDADELDALVALVWIGRGDFERAEWRAALTLARERREGDTAKYLLGIPLLPNYLEDALSAFDQSCSDFEQREEPGI